MGQQPMGPKLTFQWTLFVLDIYTIWVTCKKKNKSIYFICSKSIFSKLFPLNLFMLIFLYSRKEIKNKNHADPFAYLVQLWTQIRHTFLWHNIWQRFASETNFWQVLLSDVSDSNHRKVLGRSKHRWYIFFLSFGNNTINIYVTIVAAMKVQ